MRPLLFGLLLVLLPLPATAELLVDKLVIDHNKRRETFVFEVHLRNGTAATKPGVQVRLYIRKPSATIWEPLESWNNLPRLTPHQRLVKYVRVDMKYPDHHPSLDEGAFQLRAEASSDGHTDFKEAEYP